MRSYILDVHRVAPGALLLVALAAPAMAGTLPTSRLSGGGSRGASDCVTGLDLTGAVVSSKARSVVCHDGDQTCDRDRLVNGRCEFWVRVCLATGDGCEGAVEHVEVDQVDGDQDRITLARTLESIETPIASETCGALTTFTVPLGKRANGSPRKGSKRLTWRATGAAGADEDAINFLCKPPVRDKRRGSISFATIQKRIFEKNCTFSGCHGVEDPEAELILTGPDVYENLVDALATTSAAQFAGKKRVVPGAPETSFLMDKLEGKLAPGEGDPMPLDRKPLSDEQIDVIRTWILAGAPKERVVGSGFTGALDRQPRIPAPPAPEGGFQAHLTPFMLGDRPETEGCQMVRLGNPAPFDAGQWELFMHEGSHHFILRAFRCTDADEDGTNDCDEPDFDARYPTGYAPCEQFGFNWGFVVGAQTPHYLVDYQTAATGVALPIHTNQPLLLNTHYTNPFADTMAEVWVNVKPVDPALVVHRARILFEQIANVFINVPPGTRNEAADYLSCAFYADANGAPDPICDLSGEAPPGADRFALLGITSHMHKRSDKFLADLFAKDGTRIERPDDMTDGIAGPKHLYVSTEYNDPVNLAFWPPIIVEKGQKLTYRCFHENGVESPVRLGCEETPGVPPGRSILDSVLGGGGIYDGAARWCRTDADCTGFGTGRCVPANLVFGELAEDDMCILPGLYYRCPDEGPCVSGAS